MRKDQQSSGVCEHWIGLPAERAQLLRGGKPGHEVPLLGGIGWGGVEFAGCFRLPG